MVRLAAIGPIVLLGGAPRATERVLAPFGNISMLLTRRRTAIVPVGGPPRNEGGVGARRRGGYDTWLDRRARLGRHGRHVAPAAQVSRWRAAERRHVGSQVVELVAKRAYRRLEGLDPLLVVGHE